VKFVCRIKKELDIEQATVQRDVEAEYKVEFHYLRFIHTDRYLDRVSTVSYISSCFVLFSKFGASRIYYCW
jgi:hypothetical protein